MKTTNNKTRRIQALNAASHKANVLAAAAADRHAKSFTEMFSISSAPAALEPSAEYLNDLNKRS